MMLIVLANSLGCVHVFLKHTFSAHDFFMLHCKWFEPRRHIVSPGRVDSGDDIRSSC